MEESEIVPFAAWRADMRPGVTHAVGTTSSAPWLVTAATIGIAGDVAATLAVAVEIEHQRQSALAVPARGATAR